MKIQLPHLKKFLKVSAIVIIFLVTIVLLTSPTLSTAQTTPNKEVVAYFTQWGIYARNYLVKNIVTSGSADTITAINYAFGHIKDGECIMVTQTNVMDAWADYQKSFNASQSVDGIGDVWNQPLKGNFNQLKKLKQQYPHIKVLISLGGWTWSEDFSDAALTPQSRQQVVASCIDIYIKGNLPIADGAGGPGAAAGVFDGIDIDWEYPAAPGHPHNTYRPEDTQNFTLLLEEFRRQLDELEAQTNETYLLTIAAPAGIDKYEKIELDQIHQHLDWINIMTYDMHGAWENVTNFHAPIYNSPDDPSDYPASEYSIDTAVQAYLHAGIPANKLIIGIPFYGRGWTGVTNANNGLYQTASQAAPGTYEAGIEDYKVLKNLNYPSFRDPVTRAFWVFDGNTFWSYDDPTAIIEKTQYINTNNLLGAMIWSLDGDDTSGTLMNAIQNGLGSGPSPTATPGGTSTPGPTNTLAPPTATTVPGSCTAQAWNVDTIYTGGNTVSHNGNEWRAKWWTQGEEPGTTGQWGVWEDLGACSGGATATPNPTNTPGVTNTPIPTATSPSGNCTSTQYVAGTTYNVGDIVQNVNNEYQCDIAGWCSSSGAWAYEPGVGLYWQDAWSYVGVCSGS